MGLAFKMLWPHSKMPPEERWKTARSFAWIVTRTEGTATRRYFAAITAVTGTRPSRFSDSAQLKTLGFLRPERLRALRWVWAAAQGLKKASPAATRNPQPATRRCGRRVHGFDLEFKKVSSSFLKLKLRPCRNQPSPRLRIGIFIKIRHKPLRKIMSFLFPLLAAGISIAWVENVRIYAG